jgi:putative FmdB family regulatory protein
MPIYEYLCPTCDHKFEKLQPMSASGAECPRCEQPAKRALSVFASLSSVVASGGSEYSQLPPPPPVHGGCGCGGGGCAH